jgi:hypothetical protein
VVMSPKSLLRHPKVVSPLEEFTRDSSWGSCCRRVSHYRDNYRHSNICARCGTSTYHTQTIWYVGSYRCHCATTGTLLSSITTLTSCFASSSPKWSYPMAKICRARWLLGVCG